MDELELVNQNRSVLGSSVSDREFAPPKTFAIEFGSKSYSKKKTSRNIKVLVSCSEELLQALVDVFFGSTTEQRAYLKSGLSSPPYNISPYSVLQLVDRLSEPRIQ